MVSRLSFRRFFILCGLSLALAHPVIVSADIGGDSYQFMEAIKKIAKGDDGEPAAKAQGFINEPGSSIVNTRERSTNRTALHYVAEANRLDWTGYLLREGAKPDFPDKDGNTPLMLATLRRSYETANLLLNIGAKVDAANNDGETPLIAAVHLADVRLIKMLLAKGANPDRADTSSGYSAREQAARNTRAPQLLRAIEDHDKKPKKEKMGPS